MKMAAILAMALLALAGCRRQDMATQDRVQTWDRAAFFGNASSIRPPVAGTVARHPVALSAPQPATIDAAMLARGRQRFDIFCAPCHGSAGDGTGMIVQRGFPAPPSFLAGALRDAKAARYYDAITNGHGVMYSYADRVDAADRWAIIAYIRALQLSQNIATAQLAPEDRAHLGAP